METDSSRPQRFDTTQWSLVIAAAHRSTAEGREAFEELCQRYWYPLYVQVRRTVTDPNRAQDLTQGFFFQMIEKNYVADADPNRGRFRTFLITSLRNFMANQWDRENAVIRGGDRKHFSFNYDDAEIRLCNDMATSGRSDRLFERLWAIELLSRVLEQLRNEHARMSQTSVFAELKKYLLPGPWPPYRESAERLEMNEGAIKVAVSRLRKRYRELLRTEISHTVSTHEEIDNEVAELFRAFSD